MNYKRRDFIRLGGTVAAGIAIIPAACQSILNDNTGGAGAFGLQLYSLREDMPKDPKGVLKQVASFGYKQVEGYEGETGMFWGMSNTEFKKYMDELGMHFVSSHCDIEKDFEKKASEAAAIGMKYLICPYRGGRTTTDEFKKIAEDFNQKGEICRKNGIKFAYHNHEYGFNKIDGQYPQDILLNNTDPSLVDFEMDIYWVVTGKQDPVEWLKKYPGRFRLGHFKDRMKNASAPDASCTLGTGSIDYPTILKTAKAEGMQYYIVEQERYDGTTPLQSAKDNAAYMKNLDL